MLTSQWAVLQASQARCGNISDAYVSALCNGSLIPAGVDIFWDALGPAFPVMMALIFLPGAYILSGDLAIPLTFIVFIGLIMGRHLPGMFSFLGVVVVAIGIGGAIGMAILRLRRES